MRGLMILISMLVGAACHGHEHDEHAGGEHADEDPRPSLSFTDWSESSELFMEMRALVRGQPSPCAAHVTRLPGFAALADGQVTVVLRGGPSEERFDSGAPTVPGIFRPVARPASVGRRRLIVQIRASGLSVDHDLGEVTVFESTEAARRAIPEEAEIAGRIPFLKEQQWPIDFGTTVVSERAIRASLRATGSIVPRSEGDVVVNAPVAGRVASSSGVFPRLGDRVAADDVLGVLAPRLEAADVASLELAVTSSNLEVRFADRERARLDALHVEGAVPERRVQDAAHVADEARASLATAQRRLEQFRRVQRTAGRGQGSVQLRAPLTGAITEVFVAPGTFVEAGTPLFRVTDLTQVWLEAHVAEADAARVGTPRGATFVVDGHDESIELPAEAIVGRGHVIDPETHTLRLLFALDNTSLQLPIGAFARVHILVGDERRVLVVPETSLVEDGGPFVVFVQVEGEAFERRIIRVGARDRGYVEALSGVRAGEHVVSLGAWSVKLAASSGAIPAHGHSH